MYFKELRDATLVKYLWNNSPSKALTGKITLRLCSYPKVIVHHHCFSHFSDYSHPAKQQLNLQTALNYLTCRGTTVVRLPGTKAKRSAGLSNWMSLLGSNGPVFECNAILVTKNRAPQDYKTTKQMWKCICMNQSKAKLKSCSLHVEASAETVLHKPSLLVEIWSFLLSSRWQI